MKTKAVPSGWLLRGGRRLDCGPYMSGALEAKLRLDSLRAKKHALQDVCAGGIDGLVNAGRIKRLWVRDGQHGRRFLSSTDILRADFSDLPFISHQAVRSNPKLVIKKGWTLITRSGTIGRMAYARSDMDGLACSEDVLRVVPDEAHIPPGFLFAYLSSTFGVPLVVGGTYGAIIQHIEPEHIANLPVPRFGRRIENEVHAMVEGAAEARSRAAHLLSTAQTELVAALGIPEPHPAYTYLTPQVATASVRELSSRADAFYYAPINTDARTAFDQARGTTTSIASIADVFIPGIFKRQYADDPDFGVPYITGADVFQLAPTSTQYLMRRVARDVDLVLRRGMIVIQEAGQLGGLIGRPVLVGSYLDGFACTNNMVRVTVKDPADLGYLFAILASEYGVRLVSREAAGSSIPHLEAGRVRALRIPWLPAPQRKRIGALVSEAQQLRDSACEMEARARRSVEHAIAEGAN